MKSLVNWAPEFPPPPYTWLITTLVDRAPADRESGTNVTTIETRTTRASKRLRNIPTLTQAFRPAPPPSGRVPEVTSIWLDEVAPDDHPPLDQDTSADVAIV